MVVERNEWGLYSSASMHNRPTCQYLITYHFEPVQDKHSSWMTREWAALLGRALLATQLHLEWEINFLLESLHGPAVANLTQMKDEQACSS